MNPNREKPVRTLNIGLIGTGDIAPAYIRGCAPFDVIDIVACADLLHDKAEAFAAAYGLKALSVDDLLARPDIDIIINATVPAAHAEVSLQIIKAGKHAYGEKPLAIDRAQAEPLMRAAAAAELRLGCAPDAFLGGGNQTARRALDAGGIGEPIAGTAFLLGRGPESWHPQPGYLLSAGRRTAPRYGTVLPDRAGPLDRSGRAGQRLGRYQLSRAHRRQRSGQGTRAAGRGQHACRRHTGIRERRHRLINHQL